MEQISVSIVLYTTQQCSPPFCFQTHIADTETFLWRVWCDQQRWLLGSVIQLQCLYICLNLFSKNYRWFVINLSSLTFIRQQSLSIHLAFSFTFIHILHQHLISVSVTSNGLVHWLQNVNPNDPSLTNEAFTTSENVAKNPITITCDKRVDLAKKNWNVC